jgi:hypothetical protein
LDEWVVSELLKCMVEDSGAESLTRCMQQFAKGVLIQSIESLLLVFHLVLVLLDKAGDVLEDMIIVVLHNPLLELACHLPEIGLGLQLELVHLVADGAYCATNVGFENIQLLLEDTLETVQLFRHIVSKGGDLLPDVEYLCVRIVQFARYEMLRATAFIAQLV